LDSRFAGIIIEEGLVSYEAIARTPIHYDIYELTIPGVLKKYDLPDLVAALAPRPVWLVNAMSPVNKPVLRREVQNIYRYSAAAYDAVSAGSQLRIRLRREFDRFESAYPEFGAPSPRAN